MCVSLCARPPSTKSVKGGKPHPSKKTQSNALSKKTLGPNGRRQRLYYAMSLSPPDFSLCLFSSLNETIVGEGKSRKKEEKENQTKQKRTRHTHIHTQKCRPCPRGRGGSKSRAHNKRMGAAPSPPTNRGMSVDAYKTRWPRSPSPQAHHAAAYYLARRLQLFLGYTCSLLLLTLSAHPISNVTVPKPTDPPNRKRKHPPPSVPFRLPLSTYESPRPGHHHTTPPRTRTQTSCSCTRPPRPVPS